MRRLLLWVLLASCAPSTYAYTPLSTRPASAKPDNCAFEILTSPPSKNFEEVGTLEYYNGPEPKTVEEFEKAVSTQVCRVGGDAIIATVEKGIYAKGTIVHYLPEMGPTIQGPPKPAESAAPVN